MTIASAHVRFRDDVIGMLRAAALDVEPAAPGRDGDVAGLLNVVLLITTRTTRHDALDALHRSPSEVRAVIAPHERSGDPLCSLPLSSLIKLLREYAPEAVSATALAPAPPLPVRIPCGRCIVCAVPLPEGKRRDMLYCGKAHRERAAYLHRQAARTGAA